MDREQAIKILDDLRSYDHDKIYDLYQNKPKSLTDALGLAIEALAIPSAEPCEDAISRQVVLDIVDSYSESQSNVEDVTQDMISDILALPPVNPQPKTGHWIEEDVFDGDIAYRCSECNELFWLDDGTPKDNGYNFCPKCGANLGEPQESEVNNG